MVKWSHKSDLLILGKSVYYNLPLCLPQLWPLLSLTIIHFFICWTLKCQLWTTGTTDKAFGVCFACVVYTCIWSTVPVQIFPEVSGVLKCISCLRHHTSHGSHCSEATGVIKGEISLDKVWWCAESRWMNSKSRLIMLRRPHSYRPMTCGLFICR